MYSQDSSAGNSTGNSSLFKESLLSISAFSMDYEMMFDPPIYEDFELKRNENSSCYTSLPVIRVFGSTSAGQRACVHIHGFLPYLYFRPLDPLDTRFTNKAVVESFLPLFKSNLERCLRVSRNTPSHSRKEFIHHMEVVEKKSIYGYQEDKNFFVKVYMRNPNDIGVCVKIIENVQTGLFPVELQTYESHIPFLLKFTLDTQVKPMDWIHISKMLFREPLPPDDMDKFLPPPGAVLGKDKNDNADTDETISPGMKHDHVSSGYSRSQSSYLSSYKVYTQGSTESKYKWNINEDGGKKSFYDYGGDEHIGVGDATQDVIGQCESQIFTQKLDVAPALTEEDMPYDPFARRTTCELELDVHVDYILNSKMQTPSFGSELWEMEAERRRRRDISPYEPASHPYTNSYVRTRTNLETQFLSRLTRLHDKGRSLLSQRSQRSTKSEDDDISALTFSHESPKSAFGAPQQSAESVLVHEQQSQKETENAINQFLQAGNDGGMDRCESSFQSPLATQGEEKALFLQEIVDDIDINNDTQEIANEIELGLLEESEDEHEDEDDDEIERDRKDITNTQAQMEKEFEYDSNDDICNLEEENFSNDDENARSHEDWSGIREDNVDIMDNRESRKEDALIEHVVNRGKITSTNKSKNPFANAERHSKHRTESGRRKHRSDKVTTKRKVDSLGKKDEDEYNSDISPEKKLFCSNFTNPDQDMSMKNEEEISVIAITENVMLLRPKIFPPCRRDLSALKSFGELEVLHSKPFFSNSRDEAYPSSTEYFRDYERNRATYRSDMPAFQPFNENAYQDSMLSSLIETDKNVKMGVPRILKRTRLLVPTYTPPTRKELFESVLSNERCNANGFPTKTIKLTSQLSTPSLSGKSMRAVNNNNNNLSMKVPLSKKQDKKKKEKNSNMTAVKKGSKSKGDTNDEIMATPVNKSNMSTRKNKNTDSSKRSKKSDITNTSSENHSDAMMTRLTTLSVEILVTTIGDLSPDPQKHPVNGIIYAVEDALLADEEEVKEKHYGVIALEYTRTSPSSDGERVALSAKVQNQLFISAGLPQRNMSAVFVSSEKEIFETFIEHVLRIDPDFILGYEIQKNSLGFLITRAKFAEHLQIDLVKVLARSKKKTFFEKNSDTKHTQEEKVEDSQVEQPLRSQREMILKQASDNSKHQKTVEVWAEEHESGIFIPGRIVMNVWRRMRVELKLFNYTAQNVASHLLGRNIPLFSTSQITRWSASNRERHKALRHIFRMTELNLILLEKLDLFRRTSEMARLYGIDFFSCMTRGSQYRVEASLVREAHKHGFLVISPSRSQVARQTAIAEIPLILEPKSGFYKDPVIVLDFQSLYPSLVIAYNLCFSTFMGKLKPGSGGNSDLGDIDTEEKAGPYTYPERFTAAALFKHHSYKEGNGTLEQPYVAPNGSMFVSSSIQKGVLPLMLKNILETRFMVKAAMKTCGKEDGIYKRVCDARQLAIKMLANVTYGYTAASFSGRMPMVELADAIVASGRGLLEYTIQYILNKKEWGPLQVIYGDTDSIFVEVQGRSKEDAFLLGQEIAKDVTSSFPSPIVLKFEKVYYPCIMVTKKRYVGRMFESIADLKQGEGHLDAKGIECVRRDQCMATVKIQEKCLRLLFATRDLSQIKAYLEYCWSRIAENSFSTRKDFIFSKEVRWNKYRGNEDSEPPGAIVIRKMLRKDTNAVPPFRWRVPYMVIFGAPNSRLRDLVVDANECMIRGNDIRINGTYYNEKHINPCMKRILQICGADIDAWYKKWKRPPTSGFRNTRGKAIYTREDSSEQRNGQGRMKQITLDKFVSKHTCFVCCDTIRNGTELICQDCKSNPIMIHGIELNLRKNQQREEQLKEICRQCANQEQPAQLFKENEKIGVEACSSLECPIFYQRVEQVCKIEDYSYIIDSLRIDDCDYGERNGNQRMMNW